MTELDLIQRLIEGVGIGTAIIVCITIVSIRFISVWGNNSKERNAIEKLRIENDRQDKDATYKEKFTFAEATKELGAKSEVLSQTIERVFEKLSSDSDKAIMATQNAETNVTKKLDEQKTALELQTQGINAITAMIEELGKLLEKYSVQHSKELETIITGKVSEVVSLIQVQIANVQNQVISEREKLYEDFTKYVDVRSVSISPDSASTSTGASGNGNGNGHGKPDGGT